MISKENYKTVRIHILTFKDKAVDRHFEKMNEDKRQKTNGSNRFICSICLNHNKFTKNSDRKHARVPKCEICSENPISRIKCDDKLQKAKDEIRLKEQQRLANLTFKNRTVAVQTQETEFNKSINLLNEVLTVFQNKKQSVYQKSNTVVLKDASISTENVRLHKPILQVSKVFQFSTDEVVLDRHNKSTIMTSHEDIIRSRLTTDLPKHKSSSVPQIKTELQNSPKEITKSKDAIEEVNRIFGNIKRKQDICDSNRPLVRNGPRILPVVKREKQEIDRIWAPCRCQSGDLSSGDSFVKPVLCHKEFDGPDKCVHMMCCLNCHALPPRAMYCQCCRGENNRFNHNRANFDCNN